MDAEYTEDRKEQNGWQKTYFRLQVRKKEGNYPPPSER